MHEEALNKGLSYKGKNWHVASPVLHCFEFHTANYSKCPVYLEHLHKYMSKVSVWKLITIDHTSAQFHPYPTVSSAQTRTFTPVNSTQSYSKVLQSNTSHSQQNTPSKQSHTNIDVSDFTTLISEIKELNKTCNVKSLLTMVQKLKINSRLARTIFNVLLFFTKLLQNLNRMVLAKQSLTILSWNMRGFCQNQWNDCITCWALEELLN